MLRISALLLCTIAIVNVAASQHPVDAKPSGTVHGMDRAVADDRGPFNALGATLFWGAWGFKHDRTRLERNLDALEKAGIDYVRVLGSVGGESWNDREADPRWNDYDAVIAGLTDLAFDRYGIRVQWTLFGGAPFTPPGEARAALVDRFAKMAQGREHKIFAFEIANESWKNGFEAPAGVVEIRALGKRLADATSVMVALSAPPGGGECALYAGGGADAATVHYDRGFHADGPMRPVWQPWDYPAAFDKACPGQLPAIVFNNEPIGPQSSVQADDHAGRIAAAYAMTFLAGNAAYVLHASPGIRGGGAADIALGRPANFVDLPSFAAIAKALRAARHYLPPGIANWIRRGPGDPEAPLTGADRLYTAVANDRFVALVTGRGARATLEARRAASIEVRRSATGEVVRNIEARPGQSFTLEHADPVILIGR